MQYTAVYLATSFLQSVDKFSASDSDLRKLLLHRYDDARFLSILVQLLHADVLSARRCPPDSTTVW